MEFIKPVTITCKSTIDGTTTDYIYDETQLLNNGPYLMDNCKFCKNKIDHNPSFDRVGKRFAFMNTGSIVHAGGVPYLNSECSQIDDDQDDPRVLAPSKWRVYVEKFYTNIPGDKPKYTQVVQFPNDFHLLEVPLFDNMMYYFNNPEKVAKCLSSGRKCRKSSYPKYETCYAPDTVWECMNPEALSYMFALQVSNNKRIFLGPGQTLIKNPCDLIVINNGNVVKEHTIHLNNGDKIDFSPQEQDGQSSMGLNKWGDRTNNTVGISSGRNGNYGIFSIKDQVFFQGPC
jgi:hypothetical protein